MSDNSSRRIIGHIPYRIRIVETAVVRQNAINGPAIQERLSNTKNWNEREGDRRGVSSGTRDQPDAQANRMHLNAIGQNWIGNIDDVQA
jgi:hypothetical protein